MLNQQLNTNQENIPPKLDPIRKSPRVHKVPSMSENTKWTNEAFEQTMDAIESHNTTLKKVSKLWNIPCNSLFNHINGKTQTMKVG
jgi:hypothetical protein